LIPNAFQPKHPSQNSMIRWYTAARLTPVNNSDLLNCYLYGNSAGNNTEQNSYIG